MSEQTCWGLVSVRGTKGEDALREQLMSTPEWNDDAERFALVSTRQCATIVQSYPKAVQLTHSGTGASRVIC